MNATKSQKNSVKTVEFKSAKAAKNLASRPSSKQERAEFARGLVDESTNRAGHLLSGIKVAG